MHAHASSAYLQPGKVCASVGIPPEEPVQVAEDAFSPPLLLLCIVLPLCLRLSRLQHNVAASGMKSFRAVLLDAQWWTVHKTGGMVTVLCIAAWLRLTQESDGTAMVCQGS